MSVSRLQRITAVKYRGLKLTYLFRGQFSTPNQASDNVNVHCGTSLLLTLGGLQQGYCEYLNKSFAMDIITSNPIPSSPSKVKSTLLSSDAKKRQMSNTLLCKKNKFQEDTKDIFCYASTSYDDFNLCYLYG